MKAPVPAALVIVLAASLALGLPSPSAAAERVRGNDLSVNSAVPDTAFVDQRSRPFALASLRGRRYAMSFIYTRCPDGRMCPLVSAKFRLVQNGRRAASADLVEVTLGPQFDSPQVLQRYGRGFGADPAHWHLLTGSPRAVRAFAEAFGVRERSGEDRILHNERTVIVDSGGRVEEIIDDPSWTPNDLADILDRKESLWLRVARASRQTFAWCGEAIGPNGRIALHHTFVVLFPIVFLAGFVGLIRLVEERSSHRGERRS